MDDPGVLVSIHTQVNSNTAARVCSHMRVGPNPTQDISSMKPNKYTTHIPS